MSGTIELSDDGQQLVISFPYDRFLVDEVKKLSKRRWDPANKCWLVPTDRAAEAVTAMTRFGFALTDAVRELPGVPADAGPSAPATAKRAAASTDRTGSLFAGLQAQAPRSSTTTAESAGTNDGWSVRELNNRVREALRGAFPGTVLVRGEVVGYDRGKDRKHVFFQLVDKPEGAERVEATVDVALFERTKDALIPRLESQGLTLQDGLEILVEARIDVYPATGRYQLILENIRPEFTLGKLALGREQILRKLAEAGLTERNEQLPFPVPALRIAVLTSPDSEGWNDFRRELEASGLGFAVSLFPVKVQGEQLEPTMLAGLRYFQANAGDFDVLCIVRGGGSRTDLAWFDNLAVATAVAKHPLKVVCGIGHQRDRSVLDEIAFSLKTPTAVAAYLAGRVFDLQEDLRMAALRLRDAAREELLAARNELKDAGHRLQRSVQSRLVAERQVLRGASPRLLRAARNLITARQRTLLEAGPRLRRGCKASLREQRAMLRETARRASEQVRSRIREESHGLARASERLGHGAGRLLERAKNKLDRAADRQRLLDPARVLERGYALVRVDPGGQVAKSGSELQPGQSLRIRMRDAEVEATVDSIHVHDSAREAADDS